MFELFSIMAWFISSLLHASDVVIDDLLDLNEVVAFFIILDTLYPCSDSSTMVVWPRCSWSATLMPDSVCLLATSAPPSRTTVTLAKFILGLIRVIADRLFLDENGHPDAGDDSMLPAERNG